MTITVEVFERTRGRTVRSRVESFINKYGKKFEIEYNSNLVPMIFREHNKGKKNFYHSLQTRDMKLYDLHGIQVLFQYYNKYRDAYISNIRKSPEVGLMHGKDSIKLCISILDAIGVKRSCLHDGTQITCPDGEGVLDLSMFMIFKKGITYYMQYGFQFEPSGMLDYLYESKEEMNIHFKSLLKKVYNIKTKGIIKYLSTLFKLILDAVINDDMENIKLYTRSQSDGEVFETKLQDIDKLYFIKHLVFYIPFLCRVLTRTKKTNFVQALLELPCKTYLDLHSILTQIDMYKVTYAGRSVVNKFSILLNDIIKIRYATYCRRQYKW
jgi:hypothetical protein